MFALKEAFKSGLLSKQIIYANIVPGVIVGIVALPLAMAFAIASGVTPEKGLYTAIIAGFIVSIFGGSRVQIAGPTGAFVILLTSIIQKHGFQGLQFATFLAGIFLILMGILKLGAMIKYIPEPVIVGFTSGIALIIFVGQWKDFFGLTVHVTGNDFCTKLMDLFHAIPTLDPITTGVAMVSLFIIILINRYAKHIPGFLVALIVATVMQSASHFKTVATLGSSFGGIPQTLPAFWLPVCSTHQIVELVGPAFTLALLGAIESLLSAAVADSMLGTHHNSNQELIGQGLANIFTPLFGGFAATGAIARTATNVKSGGNSPIAGIFHCITILVFVFVLSPFAANIPIATLSAILFIVSYNMSDYRRFCRILTTAPNADRFVLIITFLLTIFVDLVVAVNIGVVLSTLFFMRRMAKSVQIEHDSYASLLHEHLHVEIPKNVSIYSIEGPFFFGAIETFRAALMSVNPSIRTFIIRLRHVPFIDVTAIDSLRAFEVSLKAKSIKVLFCEANALVRDRMRKAQLTDFGFTVDSVQKFDRSLEQAIKLAEKD